MLFLCVFLGFKLVEFQKYEKIGRFKSGDNIEAVKRFSQLTKSASQANFTNCANFAPAIMNEIKGGQI